MPDPIPYGHQWVDEDDITAVVEVLRGDYLTTGPAVGMFEAGLAGAVFTSVFPIDNDRKLPGVGALERD